MSRLSDAISEDAIAALMGQPPTSLAAFGITRWWRRKAEEARDILLEELKSGDRLNGDFETDLFYSLIFRYLNAVKQGTARRNLRLLAQMIDKGISLEGDFSVDELSSLAETAATLSKEEIALLASLWRNHPTLETPLAEEARIALHAATLEELVPTPFKTKSEALATASMLMRTGLVAMPSVWGGNRVDTTEKFYRLMKVCDIESGLRR